MSTVSDHHNQAAVIRWLGGEPRRPPARRQPQVSDDLPYVFRWKAHGRQHEPCRLFARGAMNAAGVEFADGFRMVVSVNAIRKARIGEPQ